MNYGFFKLFFILSFVGYNFCFAQQNKITSYQCKVDADLNITLNGGVKSLKIFSYYTNVNLCDTITYTFNSNGFPDKIVITERALISEGRAETVYNFENGNLISKKYFENFNLLNEKRLKYDSLGRLIELSDISRSSGKPFYIETYQYNATGQQIAYTMDNLSGDIFHKWIYIYDGNSNKIEEGTCDNYKGIKYTTDCNYKPLHGYKYNDKNQLIKKFDIGKWSPNNTDTYFQYDEHGNQIDVKGYYITTDTVLGYHDVYQYDNYGNKIMEEQKVGSYSSIGFEKYKYIKTQYDNYQNITQQEYLTVQNKLLKIVHFIYTYDSFGNWVKREKYEGKTEQELKKVLVDNRLIEYY